MGQGLSHGIGQGIGQRWRTNLSPPTGRWNRIPLHYSSSNQDPSQPFMLPTGLHPSYASQFKQASNVFRRYDRNRSGRLSQREFEDALLELGYNLDRTQLGNLFKMADTNGTGHLGEREFVEFWAYLQHHNQPGFGSNYYSSAPSNIITPPTSYNRMPFFRYSSQVQDPRQPFMMPVGLNSSFSPMFNEASAAFRMFDRDHTGRLNRREFKNAMIQLGYNVDRRELGNLFRMIDRDNNGWIDEREFVEFFLYTQHYNQPGFGAQTFGLSDVPSITTPLNRPMGTTPISTGYSTGSVPSGVQTSGLTHANSTDRTMGERVRDRVVDAKERIQDKVENLLHRDTTRTSTHT